MARIREDQIVPAPLAPDDELREAIPLQGRRPLMRLRTLHALEHRDFRFLWLGQIFNSASLWTEQVARPLLILYLIPDPSEAAVHIGLVLAARTLPQFGFGLIGGVFADWYDRRMVLLVSKTLSTLIQTAMAVLLVVGAIELWHVYLTTALRGIATAFDQPARQSLIPSVVPPEIVGNAIALNSAGVQVMRIGSAPLTGVLIVIFGFAGAFVAVAVFGAAAVLFTYLMRVPPGTVSVERGVRAAVTSLREGMRYGWAEPGIRGSLILMFGFFALATTYLQVFAPLLAKQVLGIGDSGYALMVSAAGVGALVGLLFIASIPPLTARGRLMLAAMGVLGILLVAFGLSTYLGLPALTFALIAAVGLLQSSLFAVANTILVELAQPQMRGRIIGLISLDRSMITAGGVVGGLLAAAVGPQLAQITFGAACLGLALALTFALPSFRRVR